MHNHRNRATVCDPFNPVSGTVPGSSQLFRDERVFGQGRRASDLGLAVAAEDLGVYH